MRTLALLLSALPWTSANVEKEVFSAPPAAARDRDALDVGLPRLTPWTRSLRTILNTSFVGDGEEHWILLDDMEQGKRHEVRICWSASSPTDFALKLHTAEELLSSTLVTRMRTYALASALPAESSLETPSSYSRSALYLQIQAKTGYYTYQKERMESPDSVDVEIILDPFLFNAIPESLLPIGTILIFTAGFAWWISGLIYKHLRNIASIGEESSKKVQ